MKIFSNLNKIVHNIQFKYKYVYLAKWKSAIESKFQGQIEKNQIKIRLRYLLFSFISFLLIFIFVLNHRPNYNGKHIEQISCDDKICKMLLQDIQHFKEKYNGQGGLNIDPKLKMVIYKIKPGESLWQIHEKTGLAIDTLLSLNASDNAHILQPGQDVRIPNKDGILYKIEAGDTLESIASNFKVEKRDILDVNELSEKALAAGRDIFIPNGKYDLKEMINKLGRFILPLIGRVSSPYGHRKDPITRQPEFHMGVDIANAYGSPVKAADAGTVIFVGENGGYGNLVIISHSNGYSTRYGHLSRFAVKYGQKVRQGQVIAYVGSTGHVTGPHLHFEIRRYGRPFNPYYLMRLSQK